MARNKRKRTQSSNKINHHKKQKTIKEIKTKKTVHVLLQHLERRAENENNDRRDNILYDEIPFVDDEYGFEIYEGVEEK